MDNKLKRLIKMEGNFNPSDEIIEEFLGRMEEIHLKPKERLIDYDRVNTDIYCLKEGIIRIFHIEEYRESTFGFATPGTIILSPHAYYMQTPAFLIAENCKTPAVVMRMDKNTFDSMLKDSPEFSQWMFNLAMGQLFTCEHKLFLINGAAKDRYLSILKNRPEIIDAVPGKVLASYLGVTPQYLCNLKSELMNKGK